VQGLEIQSLLLLKVNGTLEQADVVIYAGSLLNPANTSSMPSPAPKLNDSAKMSLPEVLKVMVEAAKSGKLVTRVHDGDPSFYGAIQETNGRSRQRKNRVLPNSRSKLPARRRSEH
jgi:precorrin-4 methylase